MKVLITGGAGYIGSHVVKRLLEQTLHEVVVLDNLSTGLERTIQTLSVIRNFKFIKEDLSRFEAVGAIIQQERVNAVLHFAASIMVPESVQNPLKYYMNNTVNTTHLIEQCIKCGVEQFVFSSTAAVYGNPEKMPISETTPTEPINPYGMSKLMSERVLQDAAAAHETFNYVVLRYFNVAGADVQNRIGQSFPNATNLIKVVAEAAVNKRDKIHIFGDDYNTPDGTCIRDYIHVEDLASAHLSALEYMQTRQSSAIFNCGYGHGFSVKEVVETMRNVSDINFSVVVGKRRDGDIKTSIANNEKLLRLTGWKPQYDDLALICKTALEWEKALNRGRK